MQPIPGCVTHTAIPREQLIKYIDHNRKQGYHEFTSSSWWRNQVPIALVGGGPSLCNTWRELLGYKYVMIVGGVHDFIMEKGLHPDWCIIVDGDPVVNKYLTRINPNTHYLVASQCSPETFAYLKEKNAKISIWHADGDLIDKKIDVFGDGSHLIGGGCSVGTRAMVAAIGMGFFHQHLYGFDNCVTRDYKHHAYDFLDPENETLGTVYEIRAGGPDGPKFKLAEYMVGQFFDFQAILKAFANCLQVTVHGGGLLAYIMEQGITQGQKVIEEKANGSP
jgi:Protein of unknown function DUF115